MNQVRRGATAWVPATPARARPRRTRRGGLWSRWVIVPPIGTMAAPLAHAGGTGVFDEVVELGLALVVLALLVSLFKGWWD